MTDDQCEMTNAQFMPEYYLSLLIGHLPSVIWHIRHSCKRQALLRAFRKSALLSDLRSLSRSRSMASSIERGFKTLRRIHILLRSAVSTKSSSFLVPDRLMSMAGK